MVDVEDAARLAETKLAEMLPRRWRHVRSVARRAGDPTPAGTSHLVTRLERDQKVGREADPAAGRNRFTVLTPDGDRTLRQARVTRNDVLRRTLFSATSAAEFRTLQRVWQRLATRQPDRVPTI